MWDVYGMEESYAGHLAGLMNVRELAEDLAYDIVPSFEGKNAQDVINDILRYTDTKYAMEGDKVGVVRNINVANAVNGVITTNINNFSGKESKMGLISNRLYASTLLRGAQFNSLRGNKYITPELETLYGNNLSNVYNLSTLFSIDTDNGRIVEPDSGKYVGVKMPSGNIFNYLPSMIPEFELPTNEVNGEKYDWSINPNYGTDDQQYDKRSIENINTSTFNNFSQISDKIGLYSYSEGDSKNENDNVNPTEYKFTTIENIASISNVNTIDEIDINKESLLNKTNKFLKKRQINTILSRFHDNDNNTFGLTQTALSKYGVSHGRNLLTKGAFENGEVDIINNYSNPYCRVWTSHHQYSKMKHLVRPFTEEENFTPISELQKNWYVFRGENGGARLSDYGVLNKNGMVNITPTSNEKVDVKKCMFSIENLAWKDLLLDNKGCYRLENGEFIPDNEAMLSKEQRGEHGGRIMWFPPYDLNFQETAKATWSTNDFIGRGEPVYTYTNSSRSGSLEFTILVDHPSIVDYWMLDKKNNNTENDEQTLLRFFAGCETMDPNHEAIYNLHNGIDAEGNYKDPSLEDKQDAKDIIFYTFFPNNYTACNKNGDFIDIGLDYIFGGRVNDINVKMNEEEIQQVSPKLRVRHNNPIYGTSVNAGYSSQPTTVEIEYSTENILQEQLKDITLSKYEGEADFEYVFDTQNKKIIYTLTENNTNAPRYAKYTLSYKGLTECEILIYQTKDANDIYIPEDMILGEVLDTAISTASDSGLFLGYEMGVNPMSIDKIIYQEVDDSNALYIDKIYDYTTAEKIYGEDLSEFTETVSLTKEDLLQQQEGSGDNVTKYYYEDFNSLIDKNDDSQDKKIENLNTLEILTKEKTTLEAKKKVLNAELTFLNEELKNYSKGTTAYNQVTNLINLKDIEIKDNLKEIKNREDKITDLTNKNTIFDNDLVNLNSIEEKIVQKFTITSELCCTKPLYIYYNYTDNEGVKNDANFKLNMTAIGAYVEWKMKHLDKIEVNYIEDEPYQLLTSKEFVCEAVRYFIDNDQPSDESKYWIKELVTNGVDIPYKEVRNKKDLIRKGLKFGKKRNESKYYVILNGNVIEYKSKADADNCALNLAIPIMTEEEFKESNELVAINKRSVDGGGAYKYMYYNLVSKTENNIKSAMIDYLKKESNNSDAYIVKKYYENHKFSSFKNFGIGENYGVFQLFYTGRLQENGESYETIQDIIARHNFITNTMISKPSDADKIWSYKSFAFSKRSYSEDSKGYGKVEFETNWNLETPVLSYPVDESYKDEKIQNKNHYDMRSFGLNSTLEAVKHFTKNPDATFSFGEVYAALRGGKKQKQFVLYCERGVLQQVLGKEGEELERLVKEADDRIEYLKKVFNPSEEQTDLCITEILTKGTASSHGSNAKNQILSENRRKALESFLKNFSIMSETETNKETSNIIPDEENNIVPVGESNDDISSEQAKVGRCARATIVIGKKDLLESERAYFEKRQAEKAKQDASRKKALRYDNERLFFEMLKENDNIAYNRLVDKVKYFSPAFHSITPEGFNARLTFLHQCTRQGPTATASDVSTGTTAANLAFGRAPFCILRLGDFLNTKIVIESVNITYPDSQWDLNPEGIGVQFMMAKVSMQIHILGGSDISGPIKRLQNAVSFNYYANTSVYDNRSDIAVSYTGRTDSDNVVQRQWFASPKSIEGDA